MGFNFAWFRLGLRSFTVRSGAVNYKGGPPSSPTSSLLWPGRSRLAPARGQPSRLRPQVPGPAASLEPSTATPGPANVTAVLQLQGLHIDRGFLGVSYLRGLRIEPARGPAEEVGRSLQDLLSQVGTLYRRAAKTCLRGWTLLLEWQRLLQF